MDRLKSSRLKELEVHHNKIGEYLVKRIEEIYNYKIVVHLGFNNSELLKEPSYTDIANKCLEACRLELLNLEINQYFNINDWFSLPKSITRVSVYRFDQSYDSYYGQNEGGTVSDLTINHIKRILETKHKKLITYQKCDEYWLLIKEGNYYAGTFWKINLEIPIESYFDRIFILRHKEGEILRIK